MPNPIRPKKLSIIPSQVAAPNDISSNIERINAPLNAFLSHVGLPTENLLSHVDERRKVIQALESVLEVLPIEAREKATYISKFTLCVAVGLFDGALSYLWDETIKALRRKIIDFDLGYFYSIAESLNPRYKGLKEEAEISAIGEHDLLEICRRIGLVDDINHRRLDNVNYFRNHASAAHPNDHTISGIELLGFLENCLRYAICAPIEHSVVQVKRLLENVRKHKISPNDHGTIASEVAKLPHPRIEDLLNALIGYFCDASSTQVTLENIEGLGPRIWECVNDDFKYRVGSKFGKYRANGDVPRKERLQSFLDAVGGNAFKDEDSLSAELLEKLQFLRGAHYGSNNFYNEYAYAQAVAQSLPASGIPTAARHEFVKVVTTCAIGNGHGYRQGVDENAMPLYNEFISRFSDAEFTVFAKLFADHEFTTDLGRVVSSRRAKELAKHFSLKTKNVHIKSVMDTIATAPDLQKVHILTAYRAAIPRLP